MHFKVWLGLMLSPDSKESEIQMWLANEKQHCNSFLFDRESILQAEHELATRRVLSKFDTILVPNANAAAINVCETTLQFLNAIFGAVITANS